MIFLLLGNDVVPTSDTPALATQTINHNQHEGALCCCGTQSEYAMPQHHVTVISFQYVSRMRREGEVFDGHMIVTSIVLI
jgi:hypothetical protein